MFRLKLVTINACMGMGVMINILLHALRNNISIFFNCLAAEFCSTAQKIVLLLSQFMHHASNFSLRVQSCVSLFRLTSRSVEN